MSSPSHGVPEHAPTIANGRYALAAKIGEGGMAGVYKAWDTRLRVWRAVKVLYPEFARRQKIRKRFESEAHTMARLEHQNLVRIYDVGDAGRLPFLVMELVTGGSLLGWTDRHGKMHPRAALRVIRHVVLGMAAAHEAGIVHRDIKPHNVLISANGTCKLTDFGIAHIEDEDLTKTGSVMGTLGYMAPEQRNDAKSVDHRADIYAVGATLWHLLAGEVARDVFLLADNPKLAEPIPATLRPLLLKCVAYAREARFPDARALLAEIDALLEDLPPDPPGSPGLVMDLTTETPLDQDPSFPEIREIVDGGSNSGSDPDARSEGTDEGGLVRPKALPYFMPSAKPRQPVRPPGHEESVDDLPSYVDRGHDPRFDNNFEIGVDPSMVRPEGEEQEEDERATEQGEEPAPVRSSPPARTERPPAPRSTQSTPEPRVIAPDPPPPSPPEPELTPLQALAANATVPIGVALALATIAVLVAVLFVGWNAKTLYDAGTRTNGARARLHETVAANRQIIDDLAYLSANRTALEDPYMLWHDTDAEPDRTTAALRFVLAVEQETARVAGEPGSVNTHDVQQAARKLSAARAQYEGARDEWSAAATSLPGQVVIAIGAGAAPP